MTPLHRRLALVYTPDIRIERFHRFIEAILQQFPYLRGRIDARDPDVPFLCLQADIGLPPDLCTELCQHMAAHYGVAWCDFYAHATHHQDLSLGQLHRYLWHTTNRTYAGDPPRPYSCI